MIRRLFILSAIIGMAIYLIFAITAFNDKPGLQLCQGMKYTIKDSIDYGFITPNEINSLLKKKKLHPEKKQIKDINIRELEQTLSQHPFITKAECFLTSGNKVAVDIYQRVPVLRIMSNNGDDYYIDDKGYIMKSPEKAVHVAIATGPIDRKFASEFLYPLGKLLQTDQFWNAQIEQINVTNKKELELIPRVGNHTLFLGKPGDYNEKFRKLQKFYKEALNQIGWNKYERISIEFNNQIICTKKEK